MSRMPQSKEQERTSVRLRSAAVAVALICALPASASAATLDNASILNVLSSILQTFSRMLANMPQQGAPVPESVAAGGNYAAPFAAAQRIDNLSNVTVNGVRGLTASDIPSLSYLPLSGGTVTGDLAVSGAFSGGTLSLSVASTSNLVATNATSSSLFATLGHFTTGVIDSLTATAATITNLIATTITGTNATFTNATTTTIYSTTASSSNLFAQTAAVGALSANTLTLTSALPVSSGGTGANTFGQGWLYSNGGTGALAASTSPTVDYITATSTTATSTFAGPISTPNPVDVFDNFAGTAGGPVIGRQPTVGPYTWSSTGAGVAGAYAGNGIIGSTGGNTYFVIQSRNTPWEVTSTFTSTTGAPAATISVVKDYPGHNFGAMWHTNFTAGAIVSSYWNDTWNGGSGTVSGVAPTFSYQGTTCPTLTQNTYYRARLVINAPYSDASIETLDGTVLCTQHSYEPLLSTLVGPYTYIQSGDSGQIYSSFNINDRPAAPNLLYGRSVSGLDGTPIGQLSPAAANFSSINVGSGAPKGVFSVTWDGTAAQTPAVYSTATGNFIIGSTVSGNIAKLSLKNGAGGTGTVTMDGAFALTLAGNNGTTFLTKPANSGVPYFASGLGIATTSPWRTLSVTGTVGFDGLTANFGAGSLCLTANKEVVYNSGSDSCLSSLRSTKHEISPLGIDAFSQLAALQPVSFIYNNDASSTVRYGFIAEDAAAVDPHLATYGADGSISGVDDRGLLAVLVSAIQGLMSRIGNFAESFTTRELTFTRATGDEITVRKANIQQANVQELCVGSTCLTESQVQALLNQVGQQPSEPSAPTPNENTDASSTREVTDAPSIVPDGSMATSTTS